MKVNDTPHPIYHTIHLLFTQYLLTTVYLTLLTGGLRKISSWNPESLRQSTDREDTVLSSIQDSSREDTVVSSIDWLIDSNGRLRRGVREDGHRVWGEVTVPEEDRSMNGDYGRWEFLTVGAVGWGRVERIEWIPSELLEIDFSHSTTISNSHSSRLRILCGTYSKMSFQYSGTVISIFTLQCDVWISMLSRTPNIQIHSSF